MQTARVARAACVKSNWRLRVLFLAGRHFDFLDLVAIRRDFDFRLFEDKLGLVSGGPPCQPFSLGGKHGANGDVRDMFPEAVRA